MHPLRLLVLATLAAGGVLAGAAPASAHAMKADVTVGERVKLVAYYDDDTPAESAAVTVTDAEGKEVFAGATDERGVLTFARPAPGRYTLAVQSAGHAVKVEFEVKGAPEGGADAYTSRRLHPAVGLTIGVIVLVSISGASWYIRRRRRG